MHQPDRISISCRVLCCLVLCIRHFREDSNTGSKTLSEGVRSSCLVEASSVSSAFVSASAIWQDGYNCRRQCRPSLPSPTGFASTHRCSLPRTLLPPPTSAASHPRCCLRLSCRTIVRCSHPFRYFLPPHQVRAPHTTDRPAQLRKMLPPIVFTFNAGVYHRRRLARQATNTSPPHPHPTAADRPPKHPLPATRHRRPALLPAAHAPGLSPPSTAGGGAASGERGGNPRGKPPGAGPAVGNGGAGRQRGRRRRWHRQGGRQPAAAAAASGGVRGWTRGRRQTAAPEGAACSNRRPRRRPVAGMAASGGGSQRRGRCPVTGAAGGGRGGAGRGRGGQRRKRRPEARLWFRAVGWRGEISHCVGQEYGRWRYGHGIDPNRK